MIVPTDPLTYHYSTLYKPNVAVLDTQFVFMVFSVQVVHLSVIQLQSTLPKAVST